jgi:hypothetical protein
MPHMTFRTSVVFASVLLIAACSPAGNGGPAASSSSAAVIGDIEVNTPAPNATVASPLTVTGRARGMWYFEASFPVRLLDGNGQEIAVAPAQAQGDWMTEDFVPFQVTLTFVQPATPTGTLVLQKDNPSGLPEHDASVSVPVQFE